MRNLYENFADPSWWISVILFGALSSVLGAYIKSLIDSLLAKVSDSYRKRAEAQANYYYNLSKQAETDQDLQIQIALERIRLKTETTYRFVVGVICLYLSSQTVPEYASEGFSKLITWFFKYVFFGIAIVSLYSSGWSNYRSVKLGLLTRSFPTSKILDKL